MKRKYIVAFVSVAALLPFLILSFYNQPVGDDIWYTWMAKQYGFFGVQRQWFVTINGRYSANIFMSLNTWVYGSVISFKVLPVLIILSWVTVVYYLTRVFFGAITDRFKRLALSLVLVMIYYINMPGLHEGCYWMSSVTCYQIPIILYLLYPVLTSNYSCMAAWKKYLLLPVYIFVAGGFHEMIAFMAAVTGLYIIVMKWVLSKKITGRYVLFTVASALAFLVQVSSIGNRHKATITAARKHLHIQEILVKAISQTGYHIAKNCLVSPSFWMGSIIVFYCAYTYGTAISKISFSLKKAVPALGFLFSFLVLFPGLLVVSIENAIAPLRVSNVSYFAFTTGVYTIAALYGTHFSRLQSFPVFYLTILQKRTWALTLLGVAAIVFSYNERKVFSALISSDAYQYNKEVTTRLKAIENCHEDTCSFNCLQHQPPVLCAVDICQDATLARHLGKLLHKKLIKKAFVAP